MDNTRYLLLPDVNRDGECELVNILHIRAIDRLEAEDYESVNPDTGEIFEGHLDEKCIITISYLSNYDRNWRDKAHDIIVPLTMYELLKLINSEAAYYTEK